MGYKHDERRHIARPVKGAELIDVDTGMINSDAIKPLIYIAIAVIVIMTMVWLSFSYIPESHAR